MRRRFPVEAGGVFKERGRCFRKKLCLGSDMFTWLECEVGGKGEVAPRK